MSWLVDLFRVLSSCGSTFMILSLVPTIYGIHKARSTGVMPITPLATMLINCHLWMMYGVLDRNYFPMVATFSFGDLVALTYLAVYYRHTRDRAYVHKVLSVCGTIVLITTTYAVLGGLGYTRQSHAAVVSTIGYIGTVAVVLFYSSPFENIAAVFKYRSGELIPIQMVVVGILNSAAWVTYGVLVVDWFIFWPNAFTLAIGLTQAAVYMVFHPRWHPLPEGFELTTAPLGTPPITKDLEQGKPDGEILPATRSFGRLVSLSTM